MNNRIKQIRKTLGLSQEDFGMSIDVAKTTISTMEIGKRPITNRNISAICKTFNVNETWLRTGVGEMFNAVDNSSFSALKKEYNLSPKATNILQNFLNLSQSEQDEFIKLAEKVFDDISHKEEVKTEDNRIHIIAADSASKKTIIIKD